MTATTKARTNDEIVGGRLTQSEHLTAEYVAHRIDPGAISGFAWASAYRQDVTRLLAERDSILARLTTAEQERDEAVTFMATYKSRTVALNDEYGRRAIAAEARVEALSEALRQIAATESRGVPGVPWVHWIDQARAALACPPQQRGE